METSAARTTRRGETPRAAAIGLVLAVVGAVVGAALGDALRDDDADGERPCGVAAGLDDAASAAELGLPGPEGLAVDDSWGALGP